ncbi:hypothetical protein V2G26_001531 [Clonostachys chloroleuca]
MRHDERLRHQHLTGKKGLGSRGDACTSDQVRHSQKGQFRLVEELWIHPVAGRREDPAQRSLERKQRAAAESGVMPFVCQDVS